MAQSVSTSLTKSFAVSHRHEEFLSKMANDDELELSSFDDDSDEDEEKSGSNLEKYVDGARVEVKVKNKWRTGVVVNREDDNVLVKFDKRPQDRFDMKISVNSEMLKLVPQVTNTNDLTRFPFEEFFEPNENGLSDLVINRIRSDYEDLRREVEKKNIELEIERGRSKQYRNDLDYQYELIARLLNSIHEDCNLDPVNDSMRVQELLEDCVEQAELPDLGNPELLNFDI